MSEDTEDVTLYLIVHSHQYDGWNGREWAYEDAEDVAWRGYFTSREDAEAWIEAEQQRRIAEGRAKNDAALAQKNSEAQQRYEEKTAWEATRRREYDALLAAGIEPSFERPAPRGPFTPQQSTFNEQVYLKGLDENWEVVEIEPHRKEE